MDLRPLLSIVVLASTAPLGCSGSIEGAALDKGEAITSDAAKILDFSFGAEVLAPREADAKQAIVSQLMYAQGILMSAEGGNAQIGNVQLAEVVEAPAGDKKRITYEATLPVAWPKDTPAPTSYELALPRDATSYDAFNAKYDGRCGKAAHGRDAFWFDWNPKASDCALDDADVAKASAAVAPSKRETTSRYPEYDLIWGDGRLDVVAVFGIIDSDTPRDWGHVEAQKFASHARSQLSGAAARDNGANGAIREDTTVTGAVTVGGRAREVKLDVLVVSDVASAGAEFDARYDALSESADLVLYNGHAGLGQVANAFARKGKVARGKYQIVMVDGCQTFAYLDTTMTDRRREVNGAADPNGTRYLDVVANALPNPVNEFARVSSVLYDAVVRVDRPSSYPELLGGMPDEQMVVVFGEEDNRFSPR